MKSKGTLKKDTIVATVMSNLGFFLMAEKNAIHMEKTKVGDRYVLERMKEIGASSAANSPVTLFSWMRIPPETDYSVHCICCRSWWIPESLCQNWLR